MRILVLDGSENQAVAAVRSLGRKGHEVIVGSESSWSKAGWSRYASASFVYPSPRIDAIGFLDAVVDEAARVPGTLVLPMTESTTLPVSEHRHRLSARAARFVLPAHDAVLRAFDKNVTRQIAESVGFTTPRTRMACGETDVLAAGRDLGYPVVLKATASERVDVNGRTRPGGAPRYARSPEALARAFAALAQGAAPMLVQEFVAGAGAGYFALLRNGELRAEFGHRRLRDVRPTGSGSAVRESVAVEPGLRDRSLALLRALDWHGVAMVEFKVRADGVPVFLEVNGRFWNSLALAVYAGVDFPALLAQLAEHGDCDHVTTYRAGVRCRWLLGDARHVAAVMVGPPADFPGDFPRRIPTLLSVLRPVPGMRHDNFTIDDPLPGVGDWLHFFLRRLPAAARARYRS